MSNLPDKLPSFNDVIVQRLTREIAMDIRPLTDILSMHGVSEEQWEALQSNPIFQERLAKAVDEWQSAANTSDRVKLKSLAFIEEALPEFYARAHDPKEPLTAKVELLKAITKLGGLGGPVDGSIAGERLSVTINLGADQTVKIEKEVPSKVIEGALA